MIEPRLELPIILCERRIISKQEFSKINRKIEVEDVFSCTNCLLELLLQKPESDNEMFCTALGDTAQSYVALFIKLDGGR